jgi:hypothetical protein
MGVEKRCKDMWDKVKEDTYVVCKKSEEFVNIERGDR